MASPYDVAIHLSLVSNVSEGLAVIVSRLTAADIGVTKLQKGLAGLKPAVIGAVAAFAGFETLKGLWDLAKGSKELLNQQEQLRRAGISNLDVLRLTADAYDKIGEAVPTAAASEILKTVRELRAVTGTQERAEKLTPKALMVDALLSNTLGTEAHGEYYKLLRSAEMKGISTNPRKLEQLTDMAFSYITAFSGKLTPEDFQTFARRGGTAWMNMKPESFGPVAVAMADLKGSAAGTALMTLQQLQQGTMTLSKQQADTLEKAGLLDMSKTTKTGFGGGRRQLEPGAILGSLKYMGDLPGWVKNVVYPHMMAAAGGDEALFQNMLGKDAPNRNAAKMIEMFGNKKFLDQIVKDMGLAGQIQLKTILEHYQNYIKENPLGAEAAFEGQKTSMFEAIGSPIMRSALPVMREITNLFREIGKYANANPDAIDRIGKGLGVLGVALLGGGGVALAAAIGPAGWLAAGIIAAGAAVVIWKNPILAWLESVRVENWNKDITEALTPIATSLKQWFIDLPGKVEDAIKGMWENMKKNLGGLLHYESYEGGGGGVIRTSYGGADVGARASGGGGGGDLGGDHPALRAMGRGIAAKGTLLGNQRLAFDAAIAQGLSPTAAKALVANMSGESLRNPGDYHWDVSHMAQGIVQWDPTRSAAIKAHFGKFPKDMTVAEQTTAAIWEMKNKYPKTWHSLIGGGSPESMIDSLVRDYERPRDKTRAINERLRFYRGLPSDLAGPSAPSGASIMPRRSRGETHVHNHIHLDGKQIARSTSKHLANHAQYATSVGRQDGRGTFMGPGAEVFA